VHDSKAFTGSIVAISQSVPSAAVMEMLRAPKAKLENAPGFDKEHWPDLVDRPTWGNQIFSYYGAFRSLSRLLEEVDQRLLPLEAVADPEDGAAIDHSPGCGPPPATCFPTLDFIAPLEAPGQSEFRPGSDRTQRPG
jgi:hypothetical protein